MKLSPRILGCLAIGFATSAAQAVVLANPGFDAEPILGSGQAPLEIGDMKMIENDPMNPSYLSAIGGIVGWQYALPYAGTGSDHGLWRPTRFGDPDGPQMLFINNWERRVSQTTAESIQANVQYTASCQFAMPLDVPADAKAGLIQLIAGGMDAANPDLLAAGSFVLAEYRIGSAGWIDTPLDQVVAADSLTLLSFGFSVGSGSAAIGKPLTISMRTEDGSAGPTAWDNVRIDAVPEPSAWLALGCGLALLARRRGKLG